MMKKLILMLLLMPAMLQAQVYRCESQGDTYFSQIPCTENEQTVEFDDRKMNSEAGQVAVAPRSQDTGAEEAVKSPKQRLEEFVATLEQQREQQMEILNHDIANIETRMKSIDNDPASEQEQAAYNEELARLQQARLSVESQYQTIIAEARSRVTVLPK
jgi:hypothetical protein